MGAAETKEKEYLRKGRSIADFVEELREAIIAGQLMPNERLIEVDLAKKLGTNRANVRTTLALLEREGKEIIYRPLGNLKNEPRFESVGREMLRHEHTVIGLGDGGAHYGMICDAAFTTYLLTYWLNDATPAWRLTLAQAIKILTREPAVAVGLRDRGLLQPGYKADINVIDLARLKLHAPLPVCDLPAGGRRLTQKAEGYVATIVSGQVTYREGKSSGALPGRLQRFARGDAAAVAA